MKSLTPTDLPPLIHALSPPPSSQDEPRTSDAGATQTVTLVAPSHDDIDLIDNPPTSPPLETRSLSAVSHDDDGDEISLPPTSPVNPNRSTHVIDTGRVEGGHEILRQHSGWSPNPKSRELSQKGQDLDGDGGKKKNPRKVQFAVVADTIDEDSEPLSSRADELSPSSARRGARFNLENKG